VSAHRYIVWNAAMPTTAAPVKVTTGTAIKTMLQLSTPATRSIEVIEWGFSLDAASSAVGVVELLQTDVAATSGTAHVAAGVMPLDAGAAASLLTLGTGNTGYTFTVEGTTTASRLFDAKEIPIAAGLTDLDYRRVFLPRYRPVVQVSKFLRVRCTFTAATNMLCYVIFEE
jgi:hypothetical protein